MTRTPSALSIMFVGKTTAESFQVRQPTTLTAVYQVGLDQNTQVLIFDICQRSSLLEDLEDMKETFLSATSLSVMMGTTTKMLSWFAGSFSNKQPISRCKNAILCLHQMVQAECDISSRDFSVSRLFSIF